MAVIPDIPEEIDIQLQRTDFIVEKLIEKVADDDHSDVIGKAELEIQYQEYPLQGNTFTGTHHIFTSNMK